MSLRPDVLLAILGMALASYLCRAGGYAILRATRPPPFVQQMLHYLPGCIFVAFLAPVFARLGWPGWLAGLAVVLVHWRLRRLALSILVGVGAFWLLQALQQGM